MKKSIKTLMIVSIVLAFLGVGVFVGGLLILQFLGQDTGLYIDRLADSMFRSFPGLFTFENLYVSLSALISLGVIAVLSLVWLIVSIVKKHSKSVLPLIFGVLIFACTYFLLYFYLFDETYILWLEDKTPFSWVAEIKELSILETIIANIGTAPLPFVIVSFTSLGLVVISFVLTIFESFIDMAQKPEVKKAYEEGASKDDSNDNISELTSTDEMRNILLETSVPKAAEVVAPEPVVIAPIVSQPVVEPVNEEKIRSIVEEEISREKADDELIAIMHTELPNGNVRQIRNIAQEEIKKSDLVTADQVRIIIREELLRVAVTSVREENLVETKPAPAKEEEKVEVIPEPVEEEPAVEPIAPKAKIIRIPFEDRLPSMSPEMRQHFNELKSDIMAYGVKSRVSNSGDTFRLHTKTYVKMVIAGKGLKLYLAIDPKKYVNSTIPFNDVSHKGIYKEIPFAFKVKSELSFRRAKALINEAMASGGLSQGAVVNYDWVQEIIDHKATREEDDDASEAEEQ